MSTVIGRAKVQTVFPNAFHSLTSIRCRRARLTFHAACTWLAYDDDAAQVDECQPAQGQEHRHLGRQRLEGVPRQARVQREVSQPASQPFILNDIV